MHNDITTLLLEIQDVKVTKAEADHGDGKRLIATILEKSDGIQVAYFYPYPFTKIAASNVHHQRKTVILKISVKNKF